MAAMNLMSPQLQAFMTVVEMKTVHAAAVSLKLTQTAVTQRIRTLETHLKTTLFIRSRRGMELTNEGEALLRYCQTVKVLEGETIAKISRNDETAKVHVRIVGPSSIMRSRVIPNLLTITKQFSSVLLHFNFDDSDNLQQQLRSGECDFSIMTATHVSKEMAFKMLQPEHYKLVCSKQWKDRTLDDILQKEFIIDYNPTDQMTYQYLKHFDLLTLAQKERHFVNNIDSMAELVAAEVGYTTLPNEIAKPYIEQKKLMFLNEGKSFEFQPVLTWYPRVEMPTYFAAIIDKIN